MFLALRLLQLMKDAASSITLEDIIKRHKVPSTHANSSKYAVDKNITVGKLEGSIKVYTRIVKFKSLICC